MAGRKTWAPKKRWDKGDTALAYIRVSKVGNRGDDLISDDVQLAECHRWATREGVKIIDVVTDLDKTGREDTKRQIGKAISRVRAGEANGIVVWKVSRWGRNLIDSMMSVTELQESGGFIASATENLNEIDTPMGRFSLTQMLAIAQLQSDQIGETWRNIHDYRRDAGLPHTGGERFGYLYHSGEKDPAKVYVPNPATKDWLAKAYTDYASGAAITSICLELKRNGIRSVKGRTIVYRSLLASLDSGFGAGLCVDRRNATKGTGNPTDWEFYEGAHEAVIPRDVWERYLRRRGVKQAPRERNPSTRITGLMYCASCKRKMKVAHRQNRNGTKYQTYMCSLRSAQYHTTQTCDATASIAVKPAEELVRRWLDEMRDEEQAHSTHLARQQYADHARADAARVEQEIEALRRRIRRMTDLIADEDDDRQVQEYKAAQRQYREQVKILEAEAVELQVAADVSSIPEKEAFAALAAAWDRGRTDMVNQALRSVIARIEVSPGARVNNAERVRIIGTWEPEAAAPVASPQDRSAPQEV